MTTTTAPSNVFMTIADLYSIIDDDHDGPL
jgi:hypothetical protein